MFLLQDDDHSPEEQLARDEGLLDAMETLHSSEIPGDGSEWREEKVGSEVLRLWTFSRPVVVMGRSSRISEEVNIDACNTDGVPVLRTLERWGDDCRWSRLLDVLCINRLPISPGLANARRCSPGGHGEARSRNTKYAGRLQAPQTDRMERYMRPDH